MKVEIIPEVGDRFFVKKGEAIYFTNKHGGTGWSNSDYEEHYSGSQPEVEITKVWYDEEVGYRTWAKAINKDLIDYLDKVAHEKDKIIFLSQWSLQPIN